MRDQFRAESAHTPRASDALGEFLGGMADDEPLSFAQAAKLLPTRPHVSTLHRWRHGLRGVQLLTSLIGGRRVVTRRQLLDFFSALNAEIEQPSIPKPDQDRVSAAERELDDSGC